MSEHASASSTPVPAASPETATERDPRRWAALGVLLSVQFMIILDISAVNIALPTIQEDLGFSRAGLVWVVDSYVLVAGSLLLFGGRLGDVLGRRRMFMVGVAVFGLASLAAGVATSPGMLIGARLAQGLGEALAAPAALGLIALLFTETTERVKAIGLFGGISGLAGTSGPIVSGALVEYSTWRWIFLINLPVALVALVLVPRLVNRDTGRRDAVGLDLRGALLITAGLSGIVFGLIELASYDWTDARVLLPLVAGIVLLPVFALSQRSARHPLLPLSFLRERTRVVTNVVALLFSVVFFSQFFITTLYLQDVLGFGPLKAGLSFLPFGIAVGAALGLATKLIPKVGLRPVMTAGLLLAAAGALVFTRLTADGSYIGQVLPASVLLALGSGLVLPTLGNGAVHGVTDRDAGLASGLVQSMQQIGGAIGLALLTTVALRQAGDRIAGGVDPAVATTEGYVLALQIGVGVLLLAAVIAALLPRNAGSAEDLEAAPETAVA